MILLRWVAILKQGKSTKYDGIGKVRVVLLSKIANKTRWVCYPLSCRFHFHFRSLLLPLRGVLYTLRVVVQNIRIKWTNIQEPRAASRQIHPWSMMSPFPYLLESNISIQRAKRPSGVVARVSGDVSHWDSYFDFRSVCRMSKWQERDLFSSKRKAFYFQFCPSKISPLYSYCYDK